MQDSCKNNRFKKKTNGNAKDFASFTKTILKIQAFQLVKKFNEEILELGLEKVYAKYADFSAVKQYGSGGGKTNRE